MSRGTRQKAAAPLSIRLNLQGQTMLIKTFQPIILASFIAPTILFANQISFASDQANVCDEIKDANPYIVDDNNNLYAVNESNGSKNPFVYIYLKTPGGCRVLLSIQGSVVRFVKNSANKFPDVEALWHIGADESASTYYIWNGQKYVSRQSDESERLNKEALEYFKKGNIYRAINVWEKAKNLAIIPGLGLTSNAEVLNNLGFAYYTLAKKTESDKHYERALYYLDGTIQVDYNRWEAHLNLGNLYLEMNNPKDALQSYEKLLELNPNYKYADRIKAKIATLRGQLKERDN